MYDVMGKTRFQARYAERCITYLIHAGMATKIIFIIYVLTPKITSTPRLLGRIEVWALLDKTTFNPD